MTVPQIPQRTTPGFAFSNARRALLESIADREFRAEKQAEALCFFFGDQDSRYCVFCGDSFERWDHLVPITKGGDTKLGNMVPACRKCDDSKQDKDFEEWMTGNAPKSPKTRGISNLRDRVEKINAYVKKYHYRPRQPDERLTNNEIQRFNALQIDLAELRKKFDTFIAGRK